MNTEPSTGPARDRVVFWFVAVAVVAPIVFVLLGAVTLATLADRLPDPVAIHWAASGEADGFASLGSLIALLIATGGVLPVVIAVGALVALCSGERGSIFRFLGAFVAGTSAFVVVLMVGTAAMQRDLDDAAQATDVIAPLLTSFAAAGLVAAAAWFVQPPGSRAHPARTPAGKISLSATERVVWMREVMLGRIWVLLIGGTTLLLWASAIGTWWIGSPLGAWGGLLGAAIIVTVAAAVALAFRVRVDVRGLCVVSIFGFPRFRITPDEIAGVDVVQVNPIAEFGGYGVRWAPGRFGVVLRAGDAIEVRRHRGRSFVVTVDDAATGAAVLATLSSAAGASGS